MSDPDVQGAFDAWLDDSEHSVLLMSIGDECWSKLAYDAALAAHTAGRQVAITKTWNAAQATQRELIRTKLRNLAASERDEAITCRSPRAAMRHIHAGAALDAAADLLEPVQ